MGMVTGFEHSTAANDIILYHSDIAKSVARQDPQKMVCICLHLVDHTIFLIYLYIYLLESQ